MSCPEGAGTHPPGGWYNRISHPSGRCVCRALIGGATFGECNPVPRVAGEIVKEDHYLLVGRIDISSVLVSGDPEIATPQPMAVTRKIMNIARRFFSAEGLIDNLRILEWQRDFR